MTAKIARNSLKLVTTLFAFHGMAGVLVLVLGIFLFVVEMLTGVTILPARSHSNQQMSLAGWADVFAMGACGLMEIVVAWLVWFRLSKWAINLAVALIGLWTAILVGIGVGNQLFTQLTAVLITAVIVARPCFVAARKLCSILLPHATPLEMKAERWEGVATRWKDKSQSLVTSPTTIIGG